MFRTIVLDIRCLQKCSTIISPMDRIFLSIILNIPPAILRDHCIILFADHALSIPEDLSHLADLMTFSPPFRREPVLVVEIPGTEMRLRDLARSPARSMMQVVTISDYSSRDLLENTSEIEQLLTVRIQATSDGNEIDEVFEVAVPVIVDPSLWSKLDELEAVELEVLFDDDTPVLVVDGALAAKKDIMRSLLGLLRRNPARILVCGDRTAVEAPEVTVLRAGPALLAQIARRALAVMTPKRGRAEALSMPEVIQLGGRAVAVDETLEVHDLGELGILPIVAPRKSGGANYEKLWARILELLPAVIVPAVPKRPRIALVTPMFPDKGGPPHSSLDFALALAEIAEVDIWTDSDMLPAHRARVNSVFRLDRKFEPERYDGIVYVLGNHPMYVKIFDIMRVHGGALILHDAHMIDFIGTYYGRGGLEKILSSEFNGPIDTSDVGDIISNLSNYGRPFLKEILRHANPLIVHSPISSNILRDTYGSDANYFPVAMPYPFKSVDLTVEMRLQAKLGMGISPTRPCIASFGEVHMMKGAKECLFVMKELVDWGVDFQFLFVGPIAPELGRDLKHRIRQYGLQGHVFVKGAVSEADYIQYLQAVDMVLQIRNIPFGQVSGALLDAVSAGMHGVASENLARSIEAPAFIRRVRDKSSPTIYAEQLVELIETRGYEERPGPGWEEFTSKHNFALYARNFLTLLFGNRH